MVKPGGDFVAIAALSLLGFLMPVVIPQLKSREDYAFAYIDYVQTTAGVKHRTPRFE